MNFEYDIEQRKIKFHSNPEQEDVECEIHPESGIIKFKINSKSNIEPPKSFFKRVFEFIKEWKVLLIPVSVFIVERFKKFIPTINNIETDVFIFVILAIIVVILCYKFFGMSRR